jgi:serine-threonine kinase receptor-associated protein
MVKYMPVAVVRFPAHNIRDPYLISRSLRCDPLPEDGKTSNCISHSDDIDKYPVTGTIRLWQTTPGKAYGLWQGNTNGG